MIHVGTIDRTEIYATPDRWECFVPIREFHAALPPMTPEEAAEVEAVYAGTRLRLPGDTERPFRAPHNTISPAGMFGRGYPGELAYAVRGTLVLPETHLYRSAILRAIPKALRSGPTPRVLVLVLPER